MTVTTDPQLALTRVLAAPRATVYQAFTDPDQVAQWWGPMGNSIPRDDMDFDVRSGGSLRWTDTMPADPSVQVRIRFDLEDVVEDELLDGMMHVDGHLPMGFPPFETRIRLEFHDEDDGRTRLEIRQWLPEHLVAPSDNGWLESLTKLDALLAA